MGTVSLTWTFAQLVHYFGPRVFFSILCGGLIGLERELKNKPAGIKTNMLICLGASLYTSVSILIALTTGNGGAEHGDPGRVAAQIVSGIGFLGGGTIIQSRGTILGLTTAATIWVVAAIGVCIGLGHYDMAVLSSISVILVLVLTTVFEDKILGRTIPFICEVVAIDPLGHVRVAINSALAQNNLTMDDFSMRAHGESTTLILHYNGHRADHKKFIFELWNIPGIKEIKQQ